MLISNFTNKTDSGILDVDQPIKDILIVKQGGLTDFDTEKVSVKIVRKNGTSESIATAQKVKPLSEIKQMGEGYNVIQGTKKERAFAIGVSAGIALADGESINVQITEMEAEATYSIYGVQHFTNRRSIVHYGRDVIQAGKDEKIIPADTLHNIAINPTNVIEMEFRTSEGNTCTFPKAELEYQQRQTNDISRVGGNFAEMIWARENLVVLGLRDIKEIKITTNGQEVEYYVQTIKNI